MPLFAFPVGKPHFLFGFLALAGGWAVVAAFQKLIFVFSPFCSVVCCWAPPVPTTPQDDMSLERRRCIQVTDIWDFCSDKWWMFLMCSLLLSHSLSPQMMLVQLSRILENLQNFGIFLCPFKNSCAAWKTLFSSSRKKMVFLTGNIGFKVFVGMLLKVLVDIFRKFSLFFWLIKNPGSAKCICSFNGWFVLFEIQLILQQGKSQAVEIE